MTAWTKFPSRMRPMAELSVFRTSVQQAIAPSCSCASDHPQSDMSGTERIDIPDGNSTSFPSAFADTSRRRVQSARSREDADSHTQMGQQARSPKRVRHESCRWRNECATFIYYAGSMSVFSTTSRRQSGHFAGISKM